MGPTDSNMRSRFEGDASRTSSRPEGQACLDIQRASIGPRRILRRSEQQRSFQSTNSELRDQGSGQESRRPNTATSARCKSGGHERLTLGFPEWLVDGYTVDGRALNVSHFVFFDWSTNATLAKVAWRHFLRAMSSIDFMAKKHYGSIWNFQPNRGGADSSIQSREPPPRRKFPV